MVGLEQDLAHAPSTKRKGTRLQVFNSDQFGENVIAVEAHERVEVDRQTHDPAGRREQESRAAYGTFGKEGPNKGRQAGDCEFDDDAGAVDGQALAPLAQFPGIGDIGVKEWREQHERHAHCRDETAIADRRIGVAEFMQGLDDRRVTGRTQNRPSQLNKKSVVRTKSSHCREVR